MYRIKLVNQISQQGLKTFSSDYQVGETLCQEDGIIVRSASLHDYDFPSSLQAIARAGAGVNNIPIEKCTQKGIAVFNTPGANANAVKELVICGLLLSSRRIVEGIEWVKTLKGEVDINQKVEKGKKQFIGPELEGKKLGVIGLGAIGVLVANAAIKLGMDVYGYDPYLSVDAAWGMSKWVKNASHIDKIWQECDYITLHAPSTLETKHMINARSIAMMKQGVRILNFARADLVCTQALLQGLQEGKIARYVTDFVDASLIEQNNVIIMPHLGASTPESEEHCATMAVKEIMDYLENGNITHAVNLPSITEPRATPYRLCLIHKNVPNMLAQFAALLAQEHINIEKMMNKAKGEYAYTMIDTQNLVDPKPFEQLEHVIKVRLLGA